jgi:hypothetical protein
MTTRGRIFVWVMIVFILLTCTGVGLGLIAEGVGGRRALAEGPVGTLTPTDRECGKSYCAWVGTFAAADGTVTKKDVELKGGERARKSDPLPAAIPGVRLDDEANRPLAYTTGYEWYGPVIKGGVLALVGLGAAGALVVMLRRYRKKAASS